MLHEPQPFIISCQMMEIAIGLLGFGLNLYILFIISFCRVSVYNSLLIFLSVAHCLFSIIIVIFNLIAVVVSYANITHHSIVCSRCFAMLDNLQKLLWIVLPVWILWIICAMTIDRYLVIIKPMQYNKRITVSKCVTFVFLTLLLLFVFTWPFFITDLDQKNLSDLFLFNLNQKQIVKDFVRYQQICSSLIVLSILIPSTLMVTCNVHLYFIIADHRNRIQQNISIIHFHQKFFQPSYKSKPKDSFITTLNLFCTLILLLPYFVNLLGQLIFQYYNQHLSFISLLVLALTPLVNGYVYGLRCQTIKKAFKQVLQVRVH